MIYTERPPPPDVLDLSNPESKGATELQKFVDRFEDTGDLPKSKEYQAYSHKDVKEALTVLFHGKCAYCESKVSGSSQSDIEHYRPKGAVKDAEDAGVEHPGYWWLGMRWDNLLLSCMHCNQHRKQFIFDETMTLEEIERVLERNVLLTTGKKNAFPTEDNNWVTDHTVDVHSNEKPLLINPMDTNPEDHFDWKFEDQISTIKPKPGSASAVATKDVLGLNRRWLTEARATEFLLIRERANSLRKAVEKVLYAEHQETADFALVTAIDHLKALKLRCEARNSFAAMARSVLREVEDVMKSVSFPD